MSDFETAHQLEKATASHKNIAPELAFERLAKNGTASPCSLSDFTDYLNYIEHKAESLQFFLWYCDYIQRWSNLLPRQKALSPSWDSSRTAEPTSSSRFITYSHKRARSDKMTKIISIMEMGSENQATDFANEERGRKGSTSSSFNNIPQPRTPSSASMMSPTDSVRVDWQPFTIQPFRDEISRIVKHYIVESAPRQLKLLPHDREACLRAAQNTTHPSALLPAFAVTEADLRARLHPNFIRWTMSNSNAARTVFLRAVGAILILLGFSLDLFLILSRQSNLLRVVCLVLWWPGIAILIAACKSLCIVLHFRNARQVRPWEQGSNNSATVGVGGGGDDKDWSAAAQSEDEHDYDPRSFTFPPSRKGNNNNNNINTSTNSSHAAAAAVDQHRPLRKMTMQQQTFGDEKNSSNSSSGALKEEADAQWAVSYRRKTLMQRIFDETVPIQNNALRLLQDRTVLFAVVWGGVIALALTVGSLFAPSANLFL
ncbi:hypothetical protein B0T17DRAFT_611583 [Bombardia bombarda]|uniref:RGS domain-containing protein n=1 Tax=Bombardia bombarda TaxID=252184 RepID=A0AA39XJ33_9PEZI|nr:hypothetical protein B0T17DRAFT_611583 [Bombardia bombarda]